MDQVRQNYLDILCEISDSDLLQDILRQITNNPKLTFTKYIPSMRHLMLTSEYALS